MWRFYKAIILRALVDTPALISSNWVAVGASVATVVATFMIKVRRQQSFKQATNWRLKLAAMGEHWKANLRDGVLVTTGIWLILLTASLAKAMFADHQRVSAERDAAKDERDQLRKKTEEQTDEIARLENVPTGGDHVSPSGNAGGRKPYVAQQSQGNNSPNISQKSSGTNSSNVVTLGNNSPVVLNSDRKFSDATANTIAAELVQFGGTSVYVSCTPGDAEQQRLARQLRLVLEQGAHWNARLGIASWNSNKQISGIEVQAPNDYLSAANALTRSLTAVGMTAYVVGRQQDSLPQDSIHVIIGAKP